MFIIFIIHLKYNKYKVYIYIINIAFNPIFFIFIQWINFIFFIYRDVCVFFIIILNYNLIYCIVVYISIKKNLPPYFFHPNHSKLYYLVFILNCLYNSTLQYKIFSL